MDIFKAPTITRHQTTVCLKADRSVLTPHELSELEEIANDFRYLLPNGLEATGSQWIRLIEASGSANTTDAIKLIKKGMRVEDFKDDHIVFISKRTSDGSIDSERPIFRGNANACRDFSSQFADQSGLRTMSTADCSPTDLAIAEASISVRFQKASEIPGSIECRAKEFLKQSPIRPEEFTQDQIEDVSAMQWLATHMIATYGYGGIVGYKPPNPSSPSEPEPTLSLNDWQNPTVRNTMERIVSFIESMMKQGMDFEDPKNKLFLGRPSAITNPTSNLLPFESFIHPSVIGWQIPTPLVKFISRQLQGEESQDIARERN